MKINRCFGCMAEVTEYPCIYCGYDPHKHKTADYALRTGMILSGKYLVGTMLGQGGFGITYVGWDLALERKVAIKEFFPSGQVSRHRSTGSTLQWYSTQQAQAAQNSGKEMFLKEARKMSRVDNIVQVVRVRDLFQENDTAYIIMDFVEGETLKDRLKKTGPLSWGSAKRIFQPVMEAMEQVHEAGLIHRDLSPDNLMLEPGGNVRILDLGAAKDLNINTGASSVQVVKSGFSPLEQYTQKGGSGTWTDVYALAATMYYSLTGVLPPAAVDRVEDDPIRWDLPQLAALPKNVLQALRNALMVSPKKRTQTMGQFRAQLEPREKPAASTPGSRRLLSEKIRLYWVDGLEKVGEYQQALEQLESMPQSEETTRLKKKMHFLLGKQLADKEEYLDAYIHLKEANNYDYAKRLIPDVIADWVDSIITDADITQANMFKDSVSLTEEECQALYNVICERPYYTFDSNKNTWLYNENDFRLRKILLDALPGEDPQRELMRQVFIGYDPMASDLYVRENRKLLEQLWDIPVIQDIATDDMSIFAFLLGTWKTDGDEFIRFYRQENSDVTYVTNTLPCMAKPEGTDHFIITRKGRSFTALELRWENENNEELVTEFDLTLTDANKMDVYCYGDGKSYTVHYIG